MTEQAEEDTEPKEELEAEFVVGVEEFLEFVGREDDAE